MYILNMSAIIAKHSYFWGAACRLHLLVESYQMLDYVSETFWNVQKLTFWWPILTYYIHNPQFHDRLHAWLSFQSHSRPLVIPRVYIHPISIKLCIKKKSTIANILLVVFKPFWYW